ncbi:MAG TPA: response regulator, partial [Candidatus Eisenbacteria bacterium]|nr:response regulator [Candidatus Eisenbacteria bacterium]
MLPLILVVDDDPQLRALLVRFITDEGYATVTASNGEEALAAVAREAPDLILLDVEMPVMD